MKSISLQAMTVHIFELKICLSGFFKSPLWCIGFTTLFLTFTSLASSVHPNYTHRTIKIYLYSICHIVGELPLPVAVVLSVDIPET